MKIQSYGKSELALIYFPKSSQHTATVHLMSWIRGCPVLCEELAKLKRSKFSKDFSPREVDLIFKYLGKPDE